MEEKQEKEEKTEIKKKDVCPVCGYSWFQREGRCVTCVNCGWSKCEL